MPTTNIKRILRQGLDAAVCAHMGKLFGVLMTDPNDLAFARFSLGIEKLIEVRAEVVVIIEELQEPAA